jgi:hypothetical protein
MNRNTYPMVTTKNGFEKNNSSIYWYQMMSLGENDTRGTKRKAIDDLLQTIFDRPRAWHGFPIKQWVSKKNCDSPKGWYSRAKECLAFFRSHSPRRAEHRRKKIRISADLFSIRTSSAVLSRELSPGALALHSHEWHAHLTRGPVYSRPLAELGFPRPEAHAGFLAQLPFPPLSFPLSTHYANRNSCIIL